MEHFRSCCHTIELIISDSRVLSKVDSVSVLTIWELIRYLVKYSVIGLRISDLSLHRVILVIGSFSYRERFSDLRAFIFDSEASITDPILLIQMLLFRPERFRCGQTQHKIFHNSVFQMWLQNNQSTLDPKLSDENNSDLGTVYLQMSQSTQIWQVANIHIEGKIRLTE
ncbi:hypothetical protein F511_43310 [Dorcoceras hygrometricum]|uniref:Uncharacterized protein n=1 Tax=Dorcoceras hygrometricum TaxID=472368 RepID=A0A2Z7BPR4_9LAMI|nr:hypothetical protein F511_43310 [Dorcoceras hygrometricum]